MANVFSNLPCPSANGAGAAVDVSAMGSPKAIVASGSSSCLIEVQTSNDNVHWQGLTTFSAASQGIQNPNIACKWMRAVVSNYKGGTPRVDVGSTDDGTTTTPIGGGGFGGNAHDVASCAQVIGS